MMFKNASFATKMLAIALLPVATFVMVMLLRSTPSFEAVSGQSYSWKSDQWTLVNYFAEWCQPCLEELPELNELAQAGELRVFGISYDRLPDQEIKDLIIRHQIQFPVLTTKSLEALPISLPAVLPTTYIVSPGGEVVDVLYGKVTIEGIHVLLEKHKL
ncbi:TlpA family protein disulfide reductase [Marinomonas sp. IMCC 4694]|uniref:TlpA family protein disulfide reductase n=1 Tax=Marinomonas sp. IMCC 4694 TaxID=2605432 RepID=UPI0011E6117E|nr:TlpA disulfide reductase family protein [Marinomonas sp. IMCC 4694]TYL46536.1 TlpA family protein disulfide reductase [Marinomonas sp. IMCC 4694]